jgi:hypothetical protein
MEFVMERSATIDQEKAQKAEAAPKADPLEKRYGGIGCAAVKAATLLSRRKDETRKSKGFASQTKS